MPEVPLPAAPIPAAPDAGRHGSGGAHRAPALAALIAAVVGLLALAGCGSGGRGGQCRRLRQAAGRRRRELLGQHRRQLGGEEVRCRASSYNPEHRSAQLRADGQDARTMAGAQLAIVNGIGYDDWASKLLAASPRKGDRAERRATCWACMPATTRTRWYFPADVHAVIGQIVADYDRSAGDARLLRGREARLRNRRSGTLRRAAPGDPRAVRGRAGRLQREHLSRPRRKSRAEAGDALQLRQGGSRGRGSDRAGQAHG